LLLPSLSSVPRPSRTEKQHTPLFTDKFLAAYSLTLKLSGLARLFARGRSKDGLGTTTALQE
jgi:hypothetical protein